MEEPDGLTAGPDRKKTGRRRRPYNFMVFDDLRLSSFPLLKTSHL